MLILFDHVTPRGIARALSGHTVATAKDRGWDTLSNGDLLAAAEEAQAYPARPTTLIVPLPPGGAVDSLARILAEAMRKSLRQVIVIENVSGASGSIGVGRVARAAPDGYTLGIGTFAQYVNNGAIYSLPYDLLKDFEPIALLPNVPFWIIGKKNLPAGDLKELIAWLKAHPGEASAGTIGAGGDGHLCSLTIQARTGTRFQLVPYRGIAGTEIT